MFILNEAEGQTVCEVITKLKRDLSYVSGGKWRGGDDGMMMVVVVVGLRRSLKKEEEGLNVVPLKVPCLALVPRPHTRLKVLTLELGGQGG